MRPAASRCRERSGRASKFRSRAYWSGPAYDRRSSSAFTAPTSIARPAFFSAPAQAGLAATVMTGAAALVSRAGQQCLLGRALGAAKRSTVDRAGRGAKSFSIFVKCELDVSLVAEGCFRGSREQIELEVDDPTRSGGAIDLRSARAAFSRRVTWGEPAPPSGSRQKRGGRMPPSSWFAR